MGGGVLMATAQDTRKHGPRIPHDMADLQWAAQNISQLHARTNAAPQCTCKRVCDTNSGCGCHVRLPDQGPTASLITGHCKSLLSSWIE